MSVAWSVSTPWATPTTSWSGATLGGGEPIPRNATSTATVAAFATSTPGVSDG